jgi:hypothetical protein
MVSAMEQVLSKGLVQVGDRRSWRKGCRRMNICKHCVYMYINGKMIPLETLPGMRRCRDTEEWWRR